MSSKDFRRMSLALLVGGCLAAGACNGKIGTPSQTGTGNGSGAGGNGGTMGTIGGGGPSVVDPGGVTVPPVQIDQNIAFTSVRKVKNLLTGLAPTDADAALVAAQGPAGLQMLVNTWMTDQAFQPYFSGKIIPFFRNLFQQTGFTPTEDFKIQLLTNGGFDFGPIGTGAVGDDIFARLVQNLQDSFAMTAWQLVKENKPFTDTLTTRRFVMTTALKSLYIQVEMTADAPFGNNNATPAWQVDYSGTAIPLETALTSMMFSDEAPSTMSGFGLGSAMACRDAGATVRRLPRHVVAVPAAVGFHAAVPVLGQSRPASSTPRSRISRRMTSAAGSG